MTFNPSIKQPMRNAIPGSTTAAPANSHRASVPISVYRELAAELQTTQAMLDSLNAQNQQLANQNQQLRQEVENVIQSAMHMQQVVTSFKPGVNEVLYASEVRTQPSPTPLVRRPQPAPAAPLKEVIAPFGNAEPAELMLPEKLFTEQEETRHRRPSPPERASDVSGLWLVAAICVIVLTAFGTGFLIVRPLLNSR